ncbi:hypothetical protein NW761_014502 [Fusarium oxysporum]|nr:hypothetical protein NW761_014502 [Fusarium oxysporum]
MLKSYNLPASKYNPDTDLYEFQNVRYGRSLTGDLRFRAPQSPIENRTVVQTGTGTRICPQGQPQWQAKTLMAIHPRRRRRLRLQRRLWPTLFEPSGILAQAQSAFNQDFVFVTLNYRLGAFGWLNSAKVLADGDANAALLDQRFILQWDQDNIHLFGGSKDHVTIMGESGGRSSVLRHLIAAGAKCKSTKKLFQQAISQSPADIPVATSDPDELYGRFLSILKADNLDAAKSILRCHYYC